MTVRHVETLCVQPRCEAPNHCPVCGVHHPVDDMVTWCLERETRDA